jgi:DNA-directed RNA polymerase subunit H (RpoH/RPB5)
VTSQTLKNQEKKSSTSTSTIKKNAVPVYFCVRIVAEATKKEKEKEHKVLCILHDDDNGSFGVGPIRLYFSYLQEKKVSVAIFLIQKSLTPQAHSTAVVALRSMNEQSDIQLTCEHFLVSDLCLRITLRPDVPPHKTIPEEKSSQLVKKLCAKGTDLPRIKLSEDTVARHHGNAIGDVVEITTPSFMAGTYVYYCRVVH